MKVRINKNVNWKRMSRPGGGKKKYLVYVQAEKPHTVRIRFWGAWRTKVKRKPHLFVCSQYPRGRNRMVSQKKQICSPALKPRRNFTQRSSCNGHIKAEGLRSLSSVSKADAFLDFISVSQKLRTWCSEQGSEIGFVGAWDDIVYVSWFRDNTCTI